MPRNSLWATGRVYSAINKSTKTRKNKKNTKTRGPSGRYPQDIQRRDYEFCSKDKVFVLNCEIISKIKKSGQEIVYDLVNTGWRIGQYRLANWPIPVGDLVNTGWRFGQYRLVFWPIPVGDLPNSGWWFPNTGWRNGQYRLAIWSIPVANTGEGIP